MSSDHTSSEAVAALANEYLERHRNGESPSIEDYARDHPQLAERIREIFPVMLMIEDHAPAGGSLSGIAANRQALPLERLGDFRIIREIGRGGMGVVYEADQESLSRLVALKVFPTQAALNPRHEERFRRESRSAAMLHHSNIVPVFAVGEENGVLFYAMQYIRGAGLDHVIVELVRLRQKSGEEELPPANDLAVTEAAKSMLSGSSVARSDKGEFPSHDSAVQLPGQSDDSGLSESGSEYWSSVARIGVQVADALTYAHGKGMLHRDIKPSNLLLDQNATVWVTDFGLAKNLEHDDLTHTGEVLGTLRYMSPEQLSGTTDERSDLYSLGLTLYELLVLRPAYSESDRGRLMRLVAEAEPPRLRKVDRRIPRDLETIVLKAIEREPTRRYQTAAELSLDLHRYLRGEPITARPISPTERVIKWARRRPAIAGLTAALAILFFVSFGLVTWKWLDAESARELARLERDDARDAEAREAEERRRKEASLKVAERNLYYSLIAQAELEIGRNQIDKARAALDRAPAEYRGWEWGYLRGQLDNSLMTFEAGNDRAHWVRCLGFSTDGKLLATGSGLPEYVNISRHEKGVARVWNVETGKLVADLGDDVISPCGIAISPDNRRLAVAECEIGGIHRGKVKIWDLASGMEMLTLRNQRGQTRLYPTVQMRFSPDGQLLTAKRRSPQNYQTAFAGLTLSHQDELRAWDALTGRQLWQRPVMNSSYQFSPDSQTVQAKFKSNAGWEEVDARTGETKRSWQSPNGYRDPTGKFVVQWGRKLFRVFNAETGQTLYTIHDTESDLDAFAINPAGNRIATANASGAIHIWDLTIGKRLKTLRGHTSVVLCLEFSPNGRYLASGDWEGTVKLWPAEEHPRYAVLPTGYPEAIALPGSTREIIALARHPGVVAERYAATGERIATHPVPIRNNPELGLRPAIAADGSRAVGVRWDNPRQAAVYDMATGVELKRYEPGQVRAVAISRNGEYAAAVTIDRIVVWKIDDPAVEETEISLVQDSLLTQIAIGPCGRRLAMVRRTRSNSPLEIYDLVAGTITMAATTAGSPVFSPDGTRIAYGSSASEIQLVDAATGKLVQSIAGSHNVNNVAFSPDGRRLAGVTREMTVLWDTATGHEVVRFATRGKNSDPIFSPAVAFSSDGTRLAASQWNRVTLVWTAKPETTQAVPPGKSAVDPEAKREALLALSAELESLAEQGQDNPELFLARGRVQARLGDRESAAIEYTRAVELSGGDCLLLTGDGDHLAAPNLPLDEYDAFTIETWIKDWASDIVFQGYGYQRWTGKESSFQFGSLGGKFHFGRGSSQNYSFTGEGTRRFSFGTNDPGEWTHLAVVFDRSKRQLRSYTDGKLVSEVDVSRLGPYHPQRPFWIGYHSHWHGSKGLMRSLRVSRSVRYDSEFSPPDHFPSDEQTCCSMTSRASRES